MKLKNIVGLIKEYGIKNFIVDDGNLYGNNGDFFVKIKVDENINGTFDTTELYKILNLDQDFEVIDEGKSLLFKSKISKHTVLKQEPGVALKFECNDYESILSGNFDDFKRYVSYFSGIVLQKHFRFEMTALNFIQDNNGKLIINGTDTFHILRVKTDFDFKENNINFPFWGGIKELLKINYSGEFSIKKSSQFSSYFFDFCDISVYINKIDANRPSLDKFFNSEIIGQINCKKADLQNLLNQALLYVNEGEFIDCSIENGMLSLLKKTKVNIFEGNIECSGPNTTFVANIRHLLKGISLIRGSDVVLKYDNLVQRIDFDEGIYLSAKPAK